MDLKISELIAAGVLNGAELLEIVQVGVNKKTTLSDICAHCSAPNVIDVDVDNPIMTGGGIIGNPTFIGRRPHTFVSLGDAGILTTGYTFDFVNSTGTAVEFRAQAPGITINGGTDNVIISDKSNATVTVVGEDAWIVEDKSLAKSVSDPSSVVLEPVIIDSVSDGQTVFTNPDLVFAKAIALVMVESDWLDKHDDYIFTLGNDSIELAGAYSSGLYNGQKLKILITK